MMSDQQKLKMRLCAALNAPEGTVKIVLTATATEPVMVEFTVQRFFDPASRDAVSDVLVELQQLRRPAGGGAR